MEELKTYTKGKKILKIFQDIDGESPREWDNLGSIFIPSSNNYSYLADKKEYDFNGTFVEYAEHLKEEFKAVVLLPLFVYEHSGISISTTREYPFNCSWDSSVVGYIIATKEDIKENFGVKKVTKKLLTQTEKILKGEIETYKQYVEGDIYGFQLVELKECKECNHIEEEHLESCWGFFGTDFKENGLIEHTGITDLDKWEEKENY